MKKAFIAQARMTSNRLPGKVLKDVCGESALYRMIERMRLTTHEMDIVIATTVNQEDDIIEEIAKKCGVGIFRGSENNVLSRYYYAAKENKIDIIGRVTCDDLLFDPRWLFDQLMDEFLSDRSFDYFNAMDYDNEKDVWLDSEPCCGCAVEIFAFEGIERCFKEATNQYCIEHVTPYFYMNPNLFKCGGHGSNYSGVRFLPNGYADRYGTSLDTPQDLQLLRCIYEALYPENSKFGIQDIIDAYQKHPEWYDIISDVSRTPVTYHGENGKYSIINIC